MNNRKREIRRFLVGAYMEGQDGLEACTGLFNPFLAGSRRGALSAYLFGITTVKCVINYRGKAEKVIAAFGKAFADVGRHAKLASAPETLCTVVLPLIRTPYAFTFETDSGDGVLIYYSARGLLTRIKGRIQLKKLLNTIDDSLPISVEKKQSRRRKGKASEKEETKKQKANDDAASGKQ